MRPNKLHIIQTLRAGDTANRVELGNPILQVRKMAISYYV